MKGGTPPYTITVASLNVAMTNATLGKQFDTYYWVNRASPETTLIGKWWSLKPHIFTNIVVHVM
jgi:hypothetical protein